MKITTIEQQANNILEGQPSYIWSGDIKRYKLIREAIDYLLENNKIKIKYTESYDDQESGYLITYV